MKLSNCGTGGSKGRDADDVEIVAVVQLIDRKRRWGGSISGHKTYKRDRDGANKLLNAQYFVERAIYNADHFRRRCVMEEQYNFSVLVSNYAVN